ncbi:MAG: hypothetical protein Q9160_009283 [Pyrenula sp. 1 TL-2023]
MSNEVLILGRGTSCGHLDSLGYPNAVSWNITSSIYEPYLAKKIASYANYVQTCYTDVPDSERCGFFIKRQIQSAISRNASCPFGNLCRTKDRNIELDTGYLSLDNDLGANVPPNLRYTFRLITKCAPLITNDHKRLYNFSNDAYMRYYYGRPNLGLPDAMTGNFTYEYIQKPPFSGLAYGYTISGEDYRLGGKAAFTYNGSFEPTTSNFHPIDGLRETLTHGDLVLFYLSANELVYTSEVNDDWYAAHQHAGTFDIPQASSGNVSLYSSDEVASPLACAVQYQICRPSSTAGQDCPFSGGIYDIASTFSDQEEDEASIVSRWVMSSFVDIEDIIGALSTSSLTSRDGLQRGIQGPLSDFQWQSDVELWHNITLASLQDRVESVVGPKDPDIQQHFWRPLNTSHNLNFCESQVRIATSLLLRSLNPFQDSLWNRIYHIATIRVVVAPLMFGYRILVSSLAVLS